MLVSNRRTMRHVGTRMVAKCSMAAWVLLAITPIIVLFCALNG
ncbi:hypothetical protein [Swingsia samuiensis]|nr:hypothetical protein [Swingsia samuiensis]